MNAQVANQAVRERWDPAESTNFDHRDTHVLAVGCELTAATRFHGHGFVFVVAAHPCHAPWQRAFVAALRRKIEEIVSADQNVEAARVR